MSNDYHSLRGRLGIDGGNSAQSVKVVLNSRISEYLELIERPNRRMGSRRMFSLSQNLWGTVFRNDLGAPRNVCHEGPLLTQPEIRMGR